MYSAHPLPFVRQPFENELTTSWLDRVASLYGVSWSGLMGKSNVLSLRLPIRDYGMHPKQLALLAKAMRVEEALIRQLDLARKFHGQSVERFQCHPDTKLAAPDYCLECFHDDLCCGRDNYFRHEWAVAGVSHCHKHGTRLRSACASCGQMFSLVMKVSRGRVQVYCSACRRAMRMSETVWQPGKSQIHDQIINFETEVFRSLRSLKPRRKIPFEIVDDIAFLWFCADLPKSAGACKSPLIGWKDSSQRAPNLTTALRESWLFDGAHFKPLATVGAAYRLELIEASIAIFGNSTEGIRFCGYSRFACEATLQGLFKILDDAGREELVSRANGWPKYLRVQVKKIVNTPRSKSPYSRHYLRQPWLKSDTRLAVNSGRMPKYSHF